VGKVALQAVSWYNRDNKILCVLAMLLTSQDVRRIGGTPVDILFPHAENGNTPVKKCNGPCGRELPATTDYFFRDKSKCDGLECRCKDCRLQEKKAHQQRPDVAERRRAYNRERYHRPEMHERIRDYANAYYYRPDVHEKTLAKQKDYRSRPDTQARRHAYTREYNSRPEIQERKRAYTKTYQSRPEVRNRKRLQMRFYRSRPETRERIRTQGLASYYRHREERRLAYRLWSQRPEVQESRRAYRKAYRSQPEIQDHEQAYRKAYSARPQAYEMQLSRNRNRRARKRAVQGKHTPSQIQEQLQRQHYRCYYAACDHQKFQKVNGRYVYHVEHTFPLSRVKGTNIPANDISYIVLACPHCNESKGDKFPWEWPEGGRLL